MSLSRFCGDLHFLLSAKTGLNLPHDHHLGDSEGIAFAKPKQSLCFTESGELEWEVETCANQGVCRDQPRPDLTCPCVAESSGPDCGVETCANQGVCRDQPRPDLTCPCVAWREVDLSGRWRRVLTIGCAGTSARSFFF